MIRLRGRFMGTGDTVVTMTLRPRTGGGDMDLTARIDEADMARMNGFVRAHGGIDVAAGKLSVYSELRVRDGAVTGYVKPLFRDVSVGAVDGEEAEAKSFGRRLYERAVGAAMNILKNQSRGEVATVATISGRLDQPQFSKWEIIGRLLQNAFIKAILPGFDPPAQILQGLDDREGRRLTSGRADSAARGLVLGSPCVARSEMPLSMQYTSNPLSGFGVPAKYESKVTRVLIRSQPGTTGSGVSQGPTR